MSFFLQFAGRQTPAAHKSIQVVTVRPCSAVNYNEKDFANWLLSIVFVIESLTKRLGRMSTSPLSTAVSAAQRRFILTNDCLIVSVLSFIPNIYVMHR